MRGLALLLLLAPLPSCLTMVNWFPDDHGRGPEHLGEMATLVQAEDAFVQLSVRDTAADEWIVVQPREHEPAIAAVLAFATSPWSRESAVVITLRDWETDRCELHVRAIANDGAERQLAAHALPGADISGDRIFCAASCSVERTKKQPTGLPLPLRTTVQMQSKHDQYLAQRILLTPLTVAVDVVTLPLQLLFFGSLRLAD